MELLCCFFACRPHRPQTQGELLQVTLGQQEVELGVGTGEGHEWRRGERVGSREHADL